MNSLIIGCSYVEYLSQHSNLTIFNDKFVNLGMSGCDNRTILNKLISSLKQTTPDYIFIMFTGLSRCSYTVSKSSNILYNDYKFKKIIDDEVRLLSGGEYGSWALSKEVTPLFKPTYITLEDILHVKQNSLIDCISCINFVKSTSIPYNYTFAYDPISLEFYDHPTWGSINIDSYYWKILDKTNYIDNFFLFDYAKKHSLLLKDNFHPNDVAYQHWEKAIKEHMCKW